MSANPTHELVLEGCTPTPLAGYLKALGVLRLLGEQRPEWTVRGSWRSNRFILRSTSFSGHPDHNQALLAEFFLSDYQPTPLLAPWGARSGFYPGSSEGTARLALQDISDSARKGHKQVLRYGAAIQRVRSMLKQHGLREKPEGDEKLALLKLCRAEFPDDELPWLDACYVLTAEDRQFPPLLGTGGNEGSGSYVSGFAQMVVACVIKGQYNAAIYTCLFGKSLPATTGDQTFGQFFPEAVGGPNMTSGFEGERATNAWDYLLALEGTLAFAAVATRRLDTVLANQFASPFTVRVATSGHGGVSSREGEKSRAELWLPIWDRMVSWTELVTLLREGRATVGRRPAQDGLDFVRAIAGLGVDRGISAFQRHLIVERLGQNNLAVALQPVVVSRNPDVNLIEELESAQFLDRLRRFARDEQAPARIRSRVRQLEDALFEMAQRPEPRVLQEVIVHLGVLSLLLGKSRKGREAVLRPLCGLSESWVLKADDGSAEFRIAAALAGLHGGMPLLPFLVPVAQDKYGNWAWNPESRMAVWGEGGFAANFGHVISRRRLEAERLGWDDSPFHFRAGVSAGDVAAWLTGELNETRLTSLLLGLAHARIPMHLASRGNTSVMPAAYSALKSFFTPHSLLTHLYLLPPDRSLPLPGELVTKLQAGRTQEAVDLAWRRLRAAAFPLPASPRQAPSAQYLDGPRLLAALAIPFETAELARCLTTLAPRPSLETA
jgi:CRISPR-associated protein Csx17